MRHPSLTKIKGGLEAKRRGDEFEDILYAQAIEQGFAIVKIPPGCKQIGRNRLIRVKSPFDYLIAKSAQMVAFDCKSTALNKFPSSLVKWHQVENLEWLEKKDIEAGYLIWFRKLDQIHFFSAKYMHDNPRKIAPEFSTRFLGNRQNFDLNKMLTYSTLMA